MMAASSAIVAADACPAPRPSRRRMLLLPPVLPSPLSPLPPVGRGGEGVAGCVCVGWRGGEGGFVGVLGG